MKVVTSIAKMQELGLQTRGAGLKLGFVPTMGALHEGHMELVRRARALGDVVVVSIFVNPSQFNDPTDFERYPRTLAEDRAMLEREGVEMLFVPSADDVYPRTPLTSVEVAQLGEGLCGPGRPGHFRGVATVVASLLHMVGPDFAVFGEKDYQQLAIIRRMVADLHFPVQIVAVPTVREADGLAMSSRNRRLGKKERKAASVIYRALRTAAEGFAAGETRVEMLRDSALYVLAEQPLIALEYLEFIDGSTLEPVTRATADTVAAFAGSAAGVRLIDNVVFSRVAAELDAGRRLGDLEAEAALEQE